MQKLALMMVVMMLGMPPVSGYHTDVSPREQEARGQMETVFHPFAWFDNSGGTLATEKGISSAALNGGPPVEPGGFSVRRILQQVQRGMEGLTNKGGGPESRTRGGEEKLRRKGMEHRLRGEWPGK